MGGAAHNKLIRELARLRTREEAVADGLAWDTYYAAALLQNFIVQARKIENEFGTETKP